MVFAGLAGAALLAWPRAHPYQDDVALARIVLPRFAGGVVAMDVRSPAEGQVPLELEQGRLPRLVNLPPASR